MLDRALSEELTEHLGYEPHERAGTANSRNGTTPKRLITEAGSVDLEVPRDRAGSFEPRVVHKGQRRLDGIDKLVISLYARGMTVRDIQAHLGEIYEVEVSPDLISRITDAVLDEVKEWQSRPLDPGRFLAVVANHGVGSATRESARTSCGVRSPRTRRGRSLSSAATTSRSARVWTARLVRFGKY